MKFYEYLREVNAEEREFDAYVGNVCMPATYVGEKGIYLDNPYLHEKYGTLLNAEVEIAKPKREGNTEVCVIDGVSVELGGSFFWAAAGYVSDSEYKKLFVKAEDVQEKKPLNPICAECEKLGKECSGTTNPTWTGCIYREARKLDKLIEEIKNKYGAKAEKDIEMLLEAYLRGVVNDTDVCKLYYRNQVITFATAFKEAERIGVEEVFVFNRNPKYITNTPYFQKGIEEARESSLYTSEEEIESFHVSCDEEFGKKIFIYFKRR